MKGMILTFCIICFGCALFYSGVVLHHDEMQLDSINQAMKRSVRSSMDLLKTKDLDQRTAEVAMNGFVQVFKTLAPNNLHYSAGIVGFSAHPLLLRIQVKAYDRSGEAYLFEETMVEEVVRREE